MTMKKSPQSSHHTESSQEEGSGTSVEIKNGDAAVAEEGYGNQNSLDERCSRCFTMKLFCIIIATITVIVVAGILLGFFLPIEDACTGCTFCSDVRRQSNRRNPIPPAEVSAEYINATVGLPADAACSTNEDMAWEECLVGCNIAGCTCGDVDWSYSNYSSVPWQSSNVSQQQGY